MAAPPKGVAFGPSAANARRGLWRAMALCIGVIGLCWLCAVSLGVWFARQADALDVEDFHRELCSMTGDGRTVVFAARSGAGEGLYVCDLVSLQTRRVASGHGQVFALEISPDQRQVACVQRIGRNWTLALLPLTGGKPRVLPLPDVPLVRQIAWAADSRAIFVLRESGRSYHVDAAAGLDRVDVQTGGVTTVRELAGPVFELRLQRTGRYVGWLRWSAEPDYLRHSGKLSERCAVMNPITHETRVVSSDEAPDRTSDDGAFVLHQQVDYAAMEASHWQEGDAVPSKLWVTDAAGRATAPVWHVKAGDFEDAWPTSDGLAILVKRRDRDIGWHVERVNPADGSATRLFDRDLLVSPTTWRGPVTPAR